MMRCRTIAAGLTLLFFLGAPSAAATESVCTKWKAHYYFLADITIDIEVLGQELKGVAYVEPLIGHDMTFHFKGSIVNGHIDAVHGTGHRFQGTMTQDTFKGVAITRDGMKLAIEGKRM